MRNHASYVTIGTANEALISIKVHKDSLVVLELSINMHMGIDITTNDSNHNETNK